MQNYYTLSEVKVRSLDGLITISPSTDCASYENRPRSQHLRYEQLLISPPPPRQVNEACDQTDRDPFFIERADQ